MARGPTCEGPTAHRTGELHEQAHDKVVRELPQRRMEQGKPPRRRGLRSPRGVAGVGEGFGEERLSSQELKGGTGGDQSGIVHFALIQWSLLSLPSFVPFVAVHFQFT